MKEIDYDKLLEESARVAAEFDANEAAQGDWESGQQDLQDRNALRRVSGLSTELQDVSEAEYRQLRLERVVLVGVWTDGTPEDADNSLKELSALAQTAGSEVLEGLIQRRDKPDPGTFIGSGKVAELRQAVINTGADTVICDGELSPAQLRTLEEKVKVSEQKSKEANVQIQTVYKDKVKVVKEKVIVNQIKIQKEKEVINAECKVPVIAIESYNNAVKGGSNE